MMNDTLDYKGREYVINLEKRTLSTIYYMVAGGQYNILVDIPDGVNLTAEYKQLEDFIDTIDFYKLMDIQDLQETVKRLNKEIEYIRDSYEDANKIIEVELRKIAN